MTEGLKFVKCALLQQENDPLEYCVCTLPIPSNIGIPLFPCELPNNFKLFQSNETFSQLGMKIMDIEEEENHKFMRTICCPSLRPLTITSRDFYNNIPIQAERKFAIPFIQKNEMKVKYDGEYAGKIVQEQCCTFMKGMFHQLFIYDSNEYLIYEITANLKQKGLLCFLPFQSCKSIKYSIIDKRPAEEQLINENYTNGQIEHLFFGWSNEFCSKADQYGIKFPDSASEKDKALLIMCCIFIDYLWFENF
ncbi:unnamed protein product [Paramecium pentaurelia]|uniref:Phospholipid scramblase n=1 Tax=Paramecium pentaurelia TaxID=43138 RepID=A0A8S1W0V9_9CILI|nr:unnamed protein product [Paramecium pentaurelia]